MPAILHLENPPLRTVSIARSKELQQLRNRRFSISPPPVTPPRPTQTLIPSSCPAKIPTDWGMTPCQVEPLHLNFLSSPAGNKAIRDEDHPSPFEAWKCDHQTEQPPEATELEEFTIDTPLKTSMFYGVESWIAEFDDEELKTSLRREFSINTFRQSLPRDVTSWYYSPSTPDPSFSFGHILTPQLSQRRNGSIKTQKSKRRSSKGSQSTTSTSSSCGTGVETRSSSRKRSPGSSKRRAQRDTFRQERIKPRGVRKLPPLPPLPVLPAFTNLPLPATPALVLPALSLATDMKLDIATTNETTHNISATNMTKIEISPVAFVSAAPFFSTAPSPSLQPGGSPTMPQSQTRPKRRPLPTPPIVQKSNIPNTTTNTTLAMQATPAAATPSTLTLTLALPVAAAAISLEKSPRLFHPHQSFLTISTDSSTESPVDFFPSLIGMMDNMILARS